MEDTYLTFMRNLINDKNHSDLIKFKDVIKFMCKNVSDKLSDIVLEYLENFPQQIGLISEKLFINLLSNSKKSLHPLVLFLALRCGNIRYDIVNMDYLLLEDWLYLMSNFYQSHPLLIFDPVFVENVMNNIDIYKMLIENPHCFFENIDLFIGLHAIGFDEEECDELYTKLKTDWSILKITKEVVSFVDLVASKCDKELEFIQFLITVLFSLPPESDNVVWLSDQIINNLKMLEMNCSLQISDWDALTIKSVKFGLAENDPEFSFIRVFRKLIKKANVDKSIVSKSFELLAGHSQFSNIMLNRDVNQLQKEEVLRLIETLVKKQPSIMALSHVPLFLCSYNASLSFTDQRLLRILFHYEDNAIPMSNYRPYLWGSFAISHYQVKNHLISKTLNSFPSTTEVLSYIPSKRLKDTISFFPHERKLHIKEQKILHYCKRDSKNLSQMFDPAFFLPMISSLLATEAPLSIEKFNRSGCLSMVLACLGSLDSPMRSAAYHVLTLLRSHLFCRRAENMFWDYFISWVSNGIQDLRLTPPPQLSMISALYLSRMVLAIANHEKSIESTCCRILLARPSARLHVPELKTFLSSTTSSKDKPLHMRWFFEVIRDGIRSEIDWPVLRNMDLLNIFMVVFRSGNVKDRVLILKTMHNVFCIQPATKGGTGPWALSLMMAIDKCQEKLTSLEVLLVFQCLESLSDSSYISVNAIDFWFSIFLEYSADRMICEEGYNTLKILVSKYKDVYQVLDEDNLREVLKCGSISNVLTEDEVIKCENILDHGTENVIIKQPCKFKFLPIMVKILQSK